VKKSKLQRKYINQMRAMGDIPWPERRFKYPATLRVVGSEKSTHVGSCKRPIGEQTVSRRFRRKKTEVVHCGGRVFLKRGSLGKRRVVCEDCKARKRARQRDLRIRRQIQSRMGINLHATPRQERKTNKMLAIFRRAGSR
jgi:hypothetical protein